MRILLVHTFYQQPGGEDEVFKAESSLLEANGHQVVRYTLHNREVATMGPIAAATATVWNRTVHAELRHLLQREHPEVVHFHNTFPLMSPAVYYAVKEQGIPVIQTLHNYRLLCPNAEFFRNGTVCEDCLGQPLPLPGVVHACYRENRLASAAVAAMLTTHRLMGTWTGAIDRYIALTQFSRQKFIQGGLPADRIVIKPNFVAPDPGMGAGAGNYALFVGRLSAEKGITTLIEAWKSLGETIPLYVVGDGPLATPVQQAANTTPGITWLGRKPLTEVYDLMGNATFLVFPSQWYEGQPRTIVEALAKGTPIVGSNIGSLSELIEHQHTGMHFQPGNTTDLVQQVEWLLAHPQEREQMRRNARSQFEHHYTPEQNYHRLMEIYSSVNTSGGR